MVSSEFMSELKHVKTLDFIRAKVPYLIETAYWATFGGMKFRLEQRIEEVAQTIHDIKIGYYDTMGLAAYIQEGIETCSTQKSEGEEIIVTKTAEHYDRREWKGKHYVLGSDIFLELHPEDERLISRAYRMVQGEISLDDLLLGIK
ncbi:MAG: hypothetical protein WCV90_01155 [Candidatus Woesearchaeota archaeon]